MRVRTIARHCELPDALRDRAKELMEKLTRFQPRASHGEVIFEAVRRTRRVEGIISVDGSDPVVAKAEDDDFAAALDQMIDRLKRQLRRQRDAITEHHPHSAADKGEIPAADG